MMWKDFIILSFYHPPFSKCKKDNRRDALHASDGWDMWNQTHKHKVQKWFLSRESASFEEAPGGVRNERNLVLDAPTECGSFEDATNEWNWLNGV
jgi:hypothetical protein